MALRSAVNTVARRVALATAAQVRIIVHKKWGMQDGCRGFLVRLDRILAKIGIHEF
jgi:hypothetical protein